MARMLGGKSAIEMDFTICGDFYRGKCTREGCKFVHNVNKEAVANAQICGDFERGSCTRPRCKCVDVPFLRPCFVGALSSCLIPLSLSIYLSGLSSADTQAPCSLPTLLAS